MTEIRYAGESDKEFWFTLDRHISEAEFLRKVRDKMCYVIVLNENPVGLLRYGLFWDNTPFCNLIYVMPEFQSSGYGAQLMKFWEDDMSKQGYGMVMTSTQVDETAQHFYRKLGYKDSGSLVIDVPGYEQPMEMFFIKAI